MMEPGTRLQGKSPRRANASDTPGFRCAPEIAPMNKPGTDDPVLSPGLREDCFGQKRNVWFEWKAQLRPTGP